MFLYCIHLCKQIMGDKALLYLTVQTCSHLQPIYPHSQSAEVTETLFVRAHRLHPSRAALDEPWGREVHGKKEVEQARKRE